MRQITFQDVMTADVAQQAALGEVAMTRDGREWVYVKANEAIGTKGMALTRTANTTVTTVSSSTDSDGLLTKITEASAGWTAGDYNEAWGLVYTGTGEGQTFKVETNSADTLQLYREHRLTSALAVASSGIGLVRPFLAEKTAITTLNQVLVGVVQTTFTSAYYGWALRRGLGSVLMGAAAVANEQITPGDDTEGSCAAITNGETPDDISIVGRTIVANSSADVATLAEVNIW